MDQRVEAADPKPIKPESPPGLFSKEFFAQGRKIWDQFTPEEAQSFSDAVHFEVDIMEKHKLFGYYVATAMEKLRAARKEVEYLDKFVKSDTVQQFLSWIFKPETLKTLTNATEEQVKKIEDGTNAVAHAHVLNGTLLVAKVKTPGRTKPDTEAFKRGMEMLKGAIELAASRMGETDQAAQALLTAYKELQKSVIFSDPNHYFQIMENRAFQNQASLAEVKEAISEITGKSAPGTKKSAAAAVEEKTAETAAAEKTAQEFLEIVNADANSVMSTLENANVLLDQIMDGALDSISALKSADEALEQVNNAVGGHEE